MALKPENENANKTIANEKKEIINKIMNGEFEDILDVVDNMRIN